MAILSSEEGKRVFNGGSYNIFKMLNFAKEVITPVYRSSMDDFLDASKGSDLIIYHPKALGVVDIDVKFVAKSIYILSFNLMTIDFECNKRTINEFIEEITDKIIDFIKLGISN